MEVVSAWDLKYLPFNLKNPTKLWIDTTHIPPKDGKIHIWYACEPILPQLIN